MSEANVHKRNIVVYEIVIVVEGGRHVDVNEVKGIVKKIGMKEQNHAKTLEIRESSIS